nr:hypothetical protein [uncultured Rhodococcus sp.]
MGDTRIEQVSGTAVPLVAIDIDTDRIIPARFMKEVTFDSMGEAMFVDFDGTPMAVGGGRADEIVSCEMRPDLVREARIHWGVENNIYQFGHRGYTAVKGGAQDAPYSYMHDLVAGQYRLPWEDEVVHTDGTSCGFDTPERAYQPAEEH